ncbi:MAG TPA: MFS transporter [Acidimicrobiales bacterium]|nr:MFS transporter [Acidimicrobiales bacterium]
MAAAPTQRDAAGAGLVLRSAPGRIALAATVGASSMASLDATVVNVALPHIGDDLHAGVSALQWVLTGYLLALASLILLGGALGDRLGRRRVFLAGTAWFALASLLCGLAPTVGVLVAARVLQGAGGALMTPGSLAILQASFRESDRAAAVGAWSGLGGVAGAVGPLVGGLLVDGPGWRWAFLVNLPVAAAVVVCARRAVPESRDPHAARGLDGRGAALAVAGLAGATWSLNEAARRGWGDTLVLAAGAVAGLAVFAFVRHVRRTPDPLVPPALFRNPVFTVVNLGTVFLYAAIGLAFFLVSYQLQVAAGWSALGAGLALLPATVVMLALSARSGRLAQRIGPRLQLTAGPVLAGAGLLLLARTGRHPTWAADVLPGALLFGFGLVTFVAPLTATVMAAADADHVSVASGVNNAVARAAGLAGIAVVPVVSGLTTATGAAEVTHAFRVALVIAAVTATIAGPLMAVGLSAGVRGRRSARRLHCAVDGPPLQPDPARCPLTAAR